MSAIAAVEPRVFKVGDFVSAALRAAHLAIRPANGDHELAAVLEIAEVLDGFLECLWCFSCSKSSRNAVVSQVYYCLCKDVILRHLAVEMFVRISI